MATPSVVQSVAYTSTSNQTAPQLTGLSTTAGNLYVVCINARIGSFAVTSVTDSAGNTWAMQTQGRAGSVAESEIWTTINPSPAAITSITVNLASSVGVTFRFFEVKDANNTVPNAGYTGTSTGGTNASITSGATQGAIWPSNCLALATYNAADNATGDFSAQAFTAGTPTVLPSAGGQDLSNSASPIVAQSAYLALATVSAQTFTATLAGAHAWSVTVLIIPPAAQPTVVQSVPKTLSATANTAQLTGLTTTAGNLYAVCIGLRNTGGVSSVTDSAGNTWARAGTAAAGANSNGAEIWTTTNASPAAITSVTVNTVNTCGFVFRFFEIKDAFNTAPVDVSAAAAAKNATLSTGATSTPTYSGDLALAVAYAGSASAGEFGTAQAFTSSAIVWPWIKPANDNTDLSNIASNQAEIQSAYLLGVTVAQTYSATIITSLDAWATVIVLIRPALKPLPPPGLTLDQAVKRAAYY